MHARPILALALILAGCASNDLSFWTVRAPSGEPAILQVRRPDYVTVYVPCRAHSWTLDPTTRHFSHSFYEAACGAAQSTPSSPVFDRLGAIIPTVRIMHVSGNELALIDDHGASVVTAMRLSSSTIENRQWTLESFFDGQSLRSTAAAFGPPNPIIFVEGMIQGSPGCGALTGEYSLSADRIRMTDVGYFLAGVCFNRRNPHAPLFQFSDEIVDALNGERTIVRDGANRIRLLDNAGRTQVVLRAM